MIRPGCPSLYIYAFGGADDSAAGDSDYLGVIRRGSCRATYARVVARPARRRDGSATARPNADFELRLRECSRIRFERIDASDGSVWSVTCLVQQLREANSMRPEAVPFINPARCERRFQGRRAIRRIRVICERVASETKGCIERLVCVAVKVARPEAGGGLARAVRDQRCDRDEDREPREVYTFR